MWHIMGPLNILKPRTLGVIGFLFPSFSTAFEYLMLLIKINIMLSCKCIWSIFSYIYMMWAILMESTHAINYMEKFKRSVYTINLNLSIWFKYAASSSNGSWTTSKAGERKIDMNSFHRLLLAHNEWKRKDKKGIKLSSFNNFSLKVIYINENSEMGMSKRYKM